MLGGARAARRGLFGGRPVARTAAVAGTAAVAAPSSTRPAVVGAYGRLVGVAPTVACGPAQPLPLALSHPCQLLPWFSISLRSSGQGPSQSGG